MKFVPLATDMAKQFETAYQGFSDNIVMADFSG